MGWLGYIGEKGAEQEFAVATNMKWLVAALYTFSAIVMFVSIAFIYNLDKKKVAQMTAELNERRAAAQSVAVETEGADVVEVMEAEVIAEEIDETPEEE
jgi:Na+/melibiose symporter-like transporter